MNPTIKKIAIQYGLILASIGILFQLVAYLVDPALIGNMMIGVLILLGYLGILIYSMVAVKKGLGGYMTFKEGFTSFIVTFVVFMGISTLFNLLLFNVIDPDYAEQVKEISLESAASMMESFGMSDEMVQQSLQEQEAQMADQFSVGSMIKGFFLNTLFGAVLGLIMAAAFKKSRPLYEDENTLDA